MHMGEGPDRTINCSHCCNNHMCQCNKVLMANTGNGLASKSYDSTSTGPTGFNYYYYHAGNLTELSGTKSNVQRKQN